MVCRCKYPPLKLGRRLSKLARFTFRSVASRRRRLERGVVSDAPAAIRRCPRLPRRIYMVTRHGTDAVCWRPDKDTRASPRCDVGLSRFRRNCATCLVASLDAEWNWTWSVSEGCALLQVGFWPSCEVFCLRIHGRRRGPALGERGVGLLLRRSGRGETALVGFALSDDTRRLAYHGLCLRSARALDIQPRCSGDARLAIGQPISLAGAAYKLLGEYVDKGQRLSCWDGPLSHAQLRYAAADAWVTLRLFRAVSSPASAQTRSEGFFGGSRQSLFDGASAIAA